MPQQYMEMELEKYIMRRRQDRFYVRITESGNFPAPFKSISFKSLACRIEDFIPHAACPFCKLD